jgi:hypothetical protein
VTCNRMRDRLVSTFQAHLLKPAEYAAAYDRHSAFHLQNESTPCSKP